ncbi:MAG: hypothetical protein WCP32_16760, partial [Bacteroidota bacterium]
MDAIIEAILKLIPFSKIFITIGCSPEISAGLSALLSAILLSALIWGVKKIQRNYLNTKITKDKSLDFDYPKVKQSLDLFIPTRFQNYSPTKEEEPLFSHRFVSKSKLIPFFIKTAFNEKKVIDKFYLILADSGMG